MTESVFSVFGLWAMCGPQYFAREVFGTELGNSTDMNQFTLLFVRGAGALMLITGVLAVHLARNQHIQSNEFASRLLLAGGVLGIGVELPHWIPLYHRLNAFGVSALCLAIATLPLGAYLAVFPLPSSAKPHNK